MLWSILIAVAAPPASNDATQPIDGVRANLSSYFSINDYPAGAVARGAEGTVRFELEVGTDGRVATCRVTSSSGHADLDSATCDILRSRAAYRPARDAEGRAVTGSDRGSVTWRLPVNPAISVALIRAPAQLVITFAADGSGRLTCAALLNGNPTGEAGDRFCASVVADAAAGSFGQPGNTTLTMEVTIGLSGAMPSSSHQHGELLTEQTARLTVAASGRVTECRAGATAHHGAPELVMRGPPLCSFSRQSGLFPILPEGAAPRNGLLRRKLYMRVGGPSRS